MEGHVFRMYDTNSDGNYPLIIGNWLLVSVQLHNYTHMYKTNLDGIYPFIIHNWLLISVHNCTQIHDTNSDGKYPFILVIGILVIGNCPVIIELSPIQTVTIRFGLWDFMWMFFGLEKLDKSLFNV